MLPCLNFFDALGEKDASTLAISLRFDYEGLILGELLAKLAVLGWKQPSSGEKVVVGRCALVHVHEADPE